MPRKSTGNGQSQTDSTASNLDQYQIQCWVLISVFFVVLVAVYFNSLAGVAAEWSDAQYSHGYLIPVFSVILLLLRREEFDEVSNLDRWSGVGLIALGIGLRVVGTWYVVFAIDQYSFVVCLLGVFMLVGGRCCLRWGGPPACFLIFMYPLPGFLVDNILRPLKEFATMASRVSLQTLGVDAYQEGNVIHMDQASMGVVDQCSGLRMLTIFVALSFAVAMLAAMRPWWERLIVILSSVPIAIAVNVIRITLTGVLFYWFPESEFAKRFFHDWAGYVMMPLALGFMFLELQILSRLVVEDDQRVFVPGTVGGRGPAPVGVSRRT